MSTPLSTAPRPKTDAVAQPTSGTATSRCMDEAAISESSSLKAFHCRPAPMQSKPIASEALPRCCKKVSAGTGSFRPAQFTARPKSVAMIRGFLRTVLMTDVRGRPDTARSRRKPRGGRQNSSQQNDQKVRQDKKHTVHLFSREPRPIPQGYRTFGNRGAPAPERSLKDRIRAGKKAGYLLLISRPFSYRLTCITAFSPQRLPRALIWPWPLRAARRSRPQPPRSPHQQRRRGNAIQAASASTSQGNRRL